MTVRKGGLGRGLDAMISETASKPRTTATATKKTVAPKEKKENSVLKVKLTQVEPNRKQPRKQFDEDALLELAESIKQFGVLQPLLVKQKGDYFEIIAGERRWRASKLAGIKEVPVIVKELTEQETVEISLIENIQRENLNPIETLPVLLTSVSLKRIHCPNFVTRIISFLLSVNLTSISSSSSLKAMAARPVFLTFS